MIKRILLGLIAIMVLVTGILGGLVFYKFSLIDTVKLDESKVLTSANANPTQSETAEGVEIPETNTDTESDNLQGIEMVALVGLDTRDGAGANNSDCMIVACVNHDEKTIKLVSLYRDTWVNVIYDYYGGRDYYTKANAAYNYGGPEQFLSMINLNLDLNVTEFATTDFKALADTIDILGGLDIDLTREELIHLNNYNVETSKACGREYESIEVPDQSIFDGPITQTFHLKGTQAVSYARIRYTAGYDYKRTERQRLVIQKIMEKAASMDLMTLNEIVDTVFPQITTNLSATRILSLAKNCISYQIVDQTGFPFDHFSVMIDGTDPVVPDTLESNVIKLHEFLFPGVPYTPSDTVKEYSAHIAADAARGSTGQQAAPTEEATPTPSETPTPEETYVPTDTPTPEETVSPDPIVTEEPTYEPTPEPATPEPEPATPEPEPATPEPEPATPEPEPEPVVPDSGEGGDVMY